MVDSRWSLTLGFTCAGGWNGCLRASCKHAKLSNYNTSSQIKNPEYTTNMYWTIPHLPSLPSHKRRFVSTLTTALMIMATCTGALTSTQSALARPSVSKPPSQNSDKSTALKKHPRKITYHRSASEESPAERDRRMHRECKGMHNAGACRGYTR